MADIDRAELERKLWDTIQDTHTGMLGVMGPNMDHMQPMTAFVEPDRRAIWFYLRRDNDLIKQIQSSHKAMFCLVGKGHQLFACLNGELTEQVDPERIDKFWNPVVAAWYPEGKDSPDLTMLRFDVAEAQVWAAEKGPIGFAWEVVKANLRHELPDEGTTARLRFH